MKSQFWKRCKAVFFSALPLFALPSASVAQSLEFSDEFAGSRYGISVTDLDGTILLEHRANERFMPASNVKLFTTVAALAAEKEIEALDLSTQLLVEPTEVGPPNLVLVGHGDPTIGFGPECEERCLETLAKAVAEAGITEVGDLIGDDRWFPDESHPLGWNWDDLKFWFGTAISALSVNDNVIPLKVSPSSQIGSNVNATWGEAGGYYFGLKNEAITGPEEGEWALRLGRNQGDWTARVYGEMPIGARPVTIDIGLDTPAHFAVWALKQALEAEGVAVTGQLKTRHRPLSYKDEAFSENPDDPEATRQCQRRVEEGVAGTIIATLPPAPVQHIVDEINLDSQNLYAEVMLRQLGKLEGPGSSFCGINEIQMLMDEIGVPRTAYDIADGSGLSNYNRTTSAAITALLRHAMTTSWGPAFQDSLPVGGGEDGTLENRFRGTSLEGRIFAKTGTLNHANALSGYLQARSGKLLVFSVLVNDQPLEGPSILPELDNMLIDIAERH
ncbi:MAG: D-alanyl-D-alanine carboxypeptidase [Pseudomonadota bacterium]